MTMTSDERDDFGPLGAPDQGDPLDIAQILAGVRSLGVSRDPALDPESADDELWSKAARWTMEEATALSYGVEPEWAEWANLWHHPHARDHKKRQLLCERAQKAGDLPADIAPMAYYIAPMAYIDWAKSVGIPFPAELEQMVREATIAKPDSREDEKSIHPKELRSWQKLCLGWPSQSTNTRLGLPETQFTA